MKYYDITTLHYFDADEEVEKEEQHLLDAIVIEANQLYSILVEYEMDKDESLCVSQLHFRPLA